MFGAEIEHTYNLCSTCQVTQSNPAADPTRVREYPKIP